LVKNARVRIAVDQVLARGILKKTTSRELAISPTMVATLKPKEVYSTPSPQVILTSAVVAGVGIWDLELQQWVF
jgi:hypothetical protein